MIGLLQRVRYASVTVDHQAVGKIDQGMLVLIGLEQHDNIGKGERLIDRLLGYRIFADQGQRMNLSLRDTGGGLLLVPQFTLAADTNSGKRPSFSSAMPPAEAKLLFQAICAHAAKEHPTVATGVFGADMQVELCNDGPVTFNLQV